VTIGSKPEEEDAIRKTALLALTALSLCGLSACDGKKPETDKEKQAALLTKLLDAKPGDVITLPAGTYHLDTSLSLNVDGVTIRGEGMDKTILNFKGQVTGAEGLLVHAKDFIIEDLAIEDSKGDALKIIDGENIAIRRVRSEWTNGPATGNGAYGIYPVQTKNLLIEDSVAIAASDAGIYVGQSDNIVVRRNRAERNVAGIEIENSAHADVYDNLTTHNTGGILVFNMPNLPVPGHSTRVFHNHIESNNTGNFATKGSAVSSVPAGSGVVINSNRLVEIFDNDIIDNGTDNLSVSSYYSTGFMNKKGVSEAYDPYPEAIYVYGNRFKGGGDSPDGFDFKTLKIAMFGLSGRLPDILWDGYVNPAHLVNGKLEPSRAICIDNAPAEIINIDGPNHYKNPKVGSAEYVCSLPKLPAVVLTGPLAQ
jgi:parallel beta-helix repeat protein